MSVRTALALKFFKWPEAASVATLPVSEIRDHTHSQNNSFQCVPSRIILNVFPCPTVYQLDKTATPTLTDVLFPYYARDLQLAKVFKRIYLSFSLLPHKIKTKINMAGLQA